MGRLRAGQDANFLRSIAAEVTELFGTLDCTLYRFSAAKSDNLANKDPVWDEPNTTAFYKAYSLPGNWFDYSTTANPSEFGRDAETDAIAYLALDHLIAAGVPQDENLDYVEPGDIIAIHDRCGHEKQVYDILQTNRAGWVNSTDQFTGYELELKRRDKYVPERKTQDD